MDMSSTRLTLSLYFSYMFQIFHILSLYIFILINIKLYLASLIFYWDCVSIINLTGRKDE